MKHIPLTILLITSFSLLLTFNTQKAPINQNNQTIQNNTNNNNTNENNTNPDNNNNEDNNQEEEKNKPYNILTDYSVENDNFNVEFYKPNITSRENIVKNYKGFIELKNKFYKNTFRPFNYRFKPEDEEYKNTIYGLSSNWYLLAGFVAFMFLVYGVLRLFFGKFRGAKDDNIRPDDKIFSSMLFGNFLSCFSIFFFNIFYLYFYQI